MSQPFSGIPDPGAPRPFKRRFQSGVIQEWVRGAVPKAQRYAQDLWRRGTRYSQDLWLRGKRNPRTVAIAGGAVAVTLVGAYALSASGTKSLCPSAGGKTPPFVLLMDPVPHVAAGSALEIHYDVCGLPSRTPYRGQVRLSQQGPAGKKKSARPKPLVVSFHDKVDGLATRRSQQLALGRTRPGAYTLEFAVVDNQGRERKRLQKVWIKAQ
ncbi:MAG TPA: hypothetical protein VGC48_04140 [Gemmatimonadales bacterium]